MQNGAGGSDDLSVNRIALVTLLISQKLLGKKTYSLISRRQKVRHHLVLEDLCKSFGDVQAVKNLNLKIKKGELITLLGPSGCGKTTTMHIIAGFHLPDRGRVILNGEDITYLAPYKRNTPMVFQEYALFPHLTVFENVAYGMAIRKVPKNEIQEKVKDILEQLGLPDIATRFPNQLSGGQQQRVALARALVLDLRFCSSMSLFQTWTQN